jgi:lipopolysaccharide transport system permease protein
MSGQLKNDNDLLIIDSRSGNFFDYIQSIAKNTFLVSVFVKRDLKTIYVQTLLGPLWLLIQPLISSLVYYVIFNRVIGIKVGSEKVPFMFFYSGVSLWSLHADIVYSSANIFRDNSYIFSKVYFPRIVMVFSNLISKYIRFLIQLVLLVVVDVFIFKLSENPFVTFLICAVVSASMAFISMSYGMLVSSFSKNYKDLLYLNSFFVQLWMFITPVFYNASFVEDETIKKLLGLNPLLYYFQTFRSAFYLNYNILGSTLLLVSFSLVALLLSSFFFMRAEANAVEEI